ncbi:hypothetical protein QQF64_004765 [Cirrhinus molitorella]|uniref:Uncharacterized protein n=1 Tax=Cirrhinus molitorella TaxID=172907 RepID=A0ABR3MH76_9TELE
MTITKRLNSPSSAARDISRVIKAPFRRHQQQQHQQRRCAPAAKTAEMPFPPPPSQIWHLLRFSPSQYWHTPSVCRFREMEASDKLRVVKTST